ncbi:cadmium resistance transporter domain protein [Staphylococcus epidermidis VCU057]|nr:cadmium resistance transporter domain protein [Staphylococcus epidermidis VCU057]
MANIPGLGEVIERFSRWIMSIVYIGLGLFIIIENGTVQKLFHFVF